MTFVEERNIGLHKLQMKTLQVHKFSRETHPVCLSCNESEPCSPNLLDPFCESCHQNVCNARKHNNFNNNNNNYVTFTAPKSLKTKSEVKKQIQVSSEWLIRQGAKL